MDVSLTRTIRFSLRGDGSLESDSPRFNSYSGWPAMVGLGRYYELFVTCRGEADPATGYFINIKKIDEAARQLALPIISETAKSAQDDALGAMLSRIVEVLGDAFEGSLTSVALQLTPTYSIAMEASSMTRAMIRQRFDFSAAHRLHAEALSDEQNAATFGKCNNLNGHGHNYHLEVAVTCPVNGNGSITPVTKLEQVVDREVIERFDHKHLNLDTREFAELNPSVEHIARVIHELLDEPVKAIGCELATVTVWETEKTRASFGAVLPV